MLKRRRKLLWALGGMAAAAGLALALVSSPWFERMLGRGVVQRLEKISGGPVTLESFHFRPLTLEATLGGLAVHGRPLAGEPPFAALRSVRVRIRLSSLWRRQLVLESLEADDAELHVIRRADGSVNLPQPALVGFPEAFLEPLIDLSIGRVMLARTRFFWNDQQIPVEFLGEEFTLRMSFDPARRYAGTVSSKAQVIRFSDSSLLPASLSASFALSSREIEVRELKWECGGLRGEAALSVRNFAAPDGQFTFRAEGEVAQLAEAVGHPELKSGVVNAQGRAEFRGGSFDSQGRVEARGLVVHSPQFRLSRLDFSTDYSATRDKIELPNLAVSALGGSARGSVEVSLASPLPQTRLRLEMRSLDLAELMRSYVGVPAPLRPLRFASRINGTADAQWRGRREGFQSKFQLYFQPRGVSAPGAYPLEGRVKGVLRVERSPYVQVEEADLRTQHSSVKAEGNFGADRAALKVHFATTDFEEWRPIVEKLAKTDRAIPLTLTAPASLAGTLGGSARRPEFRGRIELGKFTFRNWAWDGFEADVRGGADHFAVSSGVLRRGNSSLKFDASLTLAQWEAKSDGPASLAVRLEKTPLAGLKAGLDLPQDFDGTATGHLQLEGTPARLTGTGEFSIENGQLAGEPFDALRARVRLANSLWHFDGLQLLKGPGRLTGEGKVDPERRWFAAKLTGRDFHLRDVRRLEWLRPPGRPALLGEAAFELEGEGTAENPRVAGTWNLAELAVQGTAVGNLAGNLEWQGRQMRVEGKGGGPEGSPSFKGAVETEGEWNGELALEYSALRADPWIQAFLIEKFSAQVRATGSLRLRGPFRKPELLEVQSETQTLQVNYPQFELRNESPLRLTYARQTLTAARFRLRGTSSDFEAEGTVRLTKPGALALSVQGKVDATLLSLVFPDIRAAGSCELKVRVGGTPADPLVFGTLSVQNVSVNYGNFPLRLTGLRGEVALEGERATLRGVRGTMGGGAVVLSGFTMVGSKPRFDARMDLERVRVPYWAGFTALLEGNLRLVGAPDQSQISGELVVRQILSSESFDLPGLLVRSGRGAQGSDFPSLVSPLASKTRLNIRVRAAPTVRMESGDFRLSADLDLRVQGTLASPVEMGTIHLLTGEAVFRGNRYRVLRGDIAMTNPFRTERVLDLEVQTLVNRYDVTVDLTGPLDRLKMSYRSDPPLPTADILTLLAFGYARQEEQLSSSTGQPLQSVGASALLSEALASPISGRLQRLFGVRRIRVDPYVATIGPTGGARITVEQQVAPQLTLTYVTTTAASQQRVIQFEWTLSDAVTLIGVREQNNIFGLEFRFHQRFK